MFTQFNFRIKETLSNLNNYLKSEELIFDVTILSFILIFDYVIPHSRVKLLDLLQHSPKYEFIISIFIQIMIGFNVGRFGQKISNTNNLKGCLNTIGFGFLFFLFVFPASFIEKGEESNSYLVLGTMLGVLAILFSVMYGAYYEKNFLNSEKKNRKKTKKFTRTFLIALSYSTLMLYQALEMEAMGMDKESVVSVLMVTIITGLLPYRILLLLEPPVNVFGVFIGIIIITINLFH